MRQEFMHICSLKLESLHIKLNYGFKLIKKISCLTQINVSSKWTVRMKVERTERRVSRGYASNDLREQGNQYGSKTGDPRVMESSILKSVII